MNFVEDDNVNAGLEFHSIWLAFHAGFDVFKLKLKIQTHVLLISLAPPPARPPAVPSSDAAINDPTGIEDEHRSQIHQHIIETRGNTGVWGLLLKNIKIKKERNDAR